MAHQEFRLIAPPHTPFHQDGSLNLPAVDKQAEWLLRTGADGSFVAGSTGECASLSMEERLRLATRWIEVTRNTELEIIVQVGDNCQSDAVRLAAHAQQTGADATAAFAPSYFKPADVESLIEFLAPIAAAASDLPFYFYDIPGATGVRLPMVEFLERAKPRIPNLVGLKYSNPDLMQMQECLQLDNGEYQVLFGMDEILLSAVVLGVHGAIGSTYNFAAAHYRRMLNAMFSGNVEQARAMQRQSVTIIRGMMRFGFMAASKTSMSYFGVDCGPVRPPFKNLTDEQREQLRASMEQLDLIALCQPEASSTPREEQAVR